MCGSLEIIQATADHVEFVTALMQDALSPYYGGDHAAHANRILEAHLAGGLDTKGFFSIGQKMFILTAGGEPAGMLHLVEKRQATVKISPLIVSPVLRGGQGAGSLLLHKAESYARDQGARQIYCTVAEQNTSAFRFFLRNGYIAAGHSDSHYLSGVTERMLFKPLYDDQFEEEADRHHISVLPFDEAKHGGQVSALLLTSLRDTFRGVDEQWVQALFAGYKRRGSGDVNEKFKLIFVAEDRDGIIYGVAGATPKKGEPIKLMPLVAAALPGFIALISDTPFAMKPYGRKLYTHLVPTAEETVALQQRGWQVDAAMPEAYREGVVTQQWSIDLDKEDSMRMVRVKRRFVEAIKDGSKNLEIRVGYEFIKTIERGERLNFAARDVSVVVEVKDVHVYKNFEDLLDNHPFNSIAPLPTRQEVLELLREIYPPFKEALGVYAFDIAPVG